MLQMLDKRLQNHNYTEISQNDYSKDFSKYVSMLKIYDTPPFWEFKGGKKKYVLWNQRSEIEFG